MRLRGKLGEGDSIAVLVVLVVVAATAILIVSLFIVYRTQMERTADKACAAEVAKAHFVNTVEGRRHAIDIEKCPMVEVQLARKELPRDTLRAEEEIKHAIAEEMRVCWETWGKGEYDLFNEGSTYCHRCAAITFDAAAQQELGIITGLRQYLDEKTAPTGSTYTQILTGADARKLENPALYNALASDIDTSKTYYVMYFHEKTRDNSGILNKVTGVASPELAAATVGTAAALPVFALTVKTSGVVAAIPIIGGPIAGAVFTAGSTASAAVGVGAGVYTYYVWWRNDDFFVTSAIFLTPASEDNYYVDLCNTAAATSVSP